MRNLRPAATTRKRRPRRDFTTPAGGFAIGFSSITDASDPYLGPSDPTPTGPSKRFDSWLQFGQDGSVTVFIENGAIGVAAHTAFRQIVVEELDLAADQVKVTLGNSDSTCNQYIGGDRSVPIDIHPLWDASSRARSLLLAAASKRLRAPAYMLDVTEGVIAPRWGLSRRVSYAELVSEITLTNLRPSRARLSTITSLRKQNRTSWFDPFVSSADLADHIYLRKDDTVSRR
jgi:CO/xanthine dehydrogenase Mo-binding subunit